MARIVMLVPTALNVGTKIVSFGFLDALVNKGVRVNAMPEIDSERIERFIGSKDSIDLFEDIYEQYKLASLDSDLVVIKGLSLSNPYAAEFNFSMAEALDAAIIFVISIEKSLEDSLRLLKVIAKPYQSRYQSKILGVVANKVNLHDVGMLEECLDSSDIKIPLFGAIPYKNELTEMGSSSYVGKSISKYFNLNWLWPFLNNVIEGAFTPTMFRYNLFLSAYKANKRIVLPEGNELRTLQAANICAVRGIAQCILLGNKRTISDACAKNNIKLNERIEIIDPKSIAEKYVASLCEIRRSKGLTAEEASKQLEDNTVLGTMMLQLGDADGLVSGAITTTADTIRPALQIIKTAPDIKLVSSVFFMCLPDQVLVYGDCAINPDPSAEELADIAIQSARSAEAFGITPRIAMLSYSTGSSGRGPGVEKVKAATEIVKQLCPNLSVDGPLQYDAAIDEKVAMIKTPNSAVAGRATVFIAPDLNVGNIVYKAVQRSTKAACVGPMLQGLRKPVNDLSRGCSVEDIVLTIAVTALQAEI